MAVVYTTAIKTARMQIVLNALNVGPDASRLKVYSPGFTLLLLDFVLPNPCFSQAVDTLNLIPVPNGTTGLGNGVATLAKIFDGSGNLVVDQLSVGVNNSNINIQNINVTVGQPNSINSGRIVHG